MHDISAARPVLITGASGFVGGYVMDALERIGIQRDCRVAVAVNSDYVPKAGRTMFLDITNAAAVGELIAAQTPAAIIHLAAVAEPASAFRDRDGSWAVNVDGTRYIAQAVMRYVPDARLVFAGSAEAYGASFNDGDGSVTEDVALKPMSAYGATKAAADVLLSQMAFDGLNVVRFRAFNHTGPGQMSAYVVPAFAEQIALIEAEKQSPIMKVGNLDARRDFLDVRDVARAYALAAIGRGDKGGVYNLSSGMARSIQSVLDELLSHSNADISVEIDPDRLRPSDVPHAAGNNSNVRRVLEWQAEIPLEVTLLAVLNYFREKLS